MFTPKLKTKNAMRNIYLLFILLASLFITSNSFSQASAYGFTASSGAYTPITGGTQVNSTIPDSYTSGAITLSPAFTFAGVSYTTAYVTSNGLVTLGGTAPSNISYNAISTTTGSGIAICPFNADLQASSITGALPEMRFETVGGNVHVFQWTDAMRYAYGDRINIQVRLNTSTGNISFVYGGSITVGSNTGRQPIIGIRTSATDYKNVKVGTGTETWAAPLAGTTTTDVCRFTSTAPAQSPNDGQTYTFIAPAPCTGAPTAGTVSAPSTVCSGFSFTLTAAGFSSGATGLTYRWQSSPNGTTWTNTAGTTPGSFTTTQTTPTYYRLVDTCTTSNLFAASNSILVGLNAATYATLPFNEDFEGTWIDGCGATGSQSIPTNSWRNNPSTGNNSWRRNDEVIANSGWSSTSGAYTPTFSSGAYSARFHSYNTSATGIFDLHLNCSAGGSAKELTFDYINTSGTDSITIQISTDGGTTFNRLDSVGLRTVWSNKTVGFSSNSATTIIRFLTKGDGGSTDIGIDNMNVLTLSGCSGTPNAGTVSGPATVCSSSTVVLTATGYTTGVGGINYRWQSSTNGTTWVNTTGTNPASFSTTITANTFFRLVDTCTNGNLFGVSNSVQVSFISSTYATLPFNEDFEATWIDGCGATGSQSIPTNSWRNNPTTGNNSWRRNDEVVANSGWSSVLGNYTPTFSSGAYSARFHSYNTALTGNFDVFINCSTGSSNKQLTFDYINTSGSDSITIQLSTDGGVTFNRLDSIGLRTVWSGKTVLFTSNSATTVIRFLTKGDNGGTDIGLDNINILTLSNCTGTPSAGTISGPASGAACSGINFTLSSTGYTTGVGGLKYRWQTSANGTTGWTNTTGTDPAGFITTQNATTFYRLVDTCTISNLFSVSNVLQITTAAPIYATLPFSEGFETDWIDGCATKDLPSNSWRNIPATTDSSWRREDDAPTTNSAVWTLPTSYLYSPAFSTGAHSARFHSGYVNNRGRGILDLFINCGTGSAARQLTFDYININGTDSLTVLLSTNGGTSFTRLDSMGLRTVWSGKTILFSSSSATTVIRFLATADYGSTDIGLDNINIIQAPSCNIPTVVTVSNIGTTSATISWTAPAVGTTPTGYEYVVSTSNTTPSGAGISNATTTVNVSTLTTSTNYFVFVRTNCGSGNFSAWTAVTQFTTLCNNVALPHNQGFEAGTTLPTCWSSSFVSGSRAFSIGTTTSAAGTTPNPAAYAGTNRLLFPSYSGSGDQTRLISAALVTTGIPSVNVDFYWYLSANGGATLYLTEGVQVQWSTDGITWTNAGSLIRRYGAVEGWVPQSVTLPAGAANQTKLFVGFLFTSNAGYDSYIDDIAIKQNPLPVTLGSFVGIKQNGNNLLSWTTSTEQNSKGFELQRSADAANFSAISFVESKAVNGTSNATLSYSFNDVKPFVGNNYYRLKQVDKDGKWAYSQVVLLKGNKAAQIDITAIYPNPVANTLNLIINAPTTDKVTVTVTDIAGKILLQQIASLAAGDNTMQLNVSKLTAGTYVIKATCQNGCDSGAKKFVKE
jgi:Secretion system C-terminal sorting domain/Fibronectin type III domain